MPGSWLMRKCHDVEDRLALFRRQLQRRFALKTNKQTNKHISKQTWWKNLVGITWTFNSDIAPAEFSVTSFLLVSLQLKNFHSHKTIRTLEIRGWLHPTAKVYQSLRVFFFFHRLHNHEWSAWWVSLCWKKYSLKIRVFLKKSVR